MPGSDDIGEAVESTDASSLKGDADDDF